MVVQGANDLAEIQDYIEQYNPLAARKLRGNITRGAELLPSIPFAFRTGRIAGTREYAVHPNYILVYKVNANGVRIVRIMHARRQYP